MHRLAVLHGGHVEAHSAGVGKGSTFTITLPLAKGVASGESVPAVAAAMRSRVLVIEDEEDSRESLKLLLEADGHQVRLADNGASALEQLATFRPDIALVDVRLPGMDGYEVARRLRSLPAGKNIKLVAMTGFGSEKDQRRARQAGFDVHLIKPVSYDQLARLFSAG